MLPIASLSQDDNKECLIKNKIVYNGLDETSSFVYYPLKDELLIGTSDGKVLSEASNFSLVYKAPGRIYNIAIGRNSSIAIAVENDLLASYEVHYLDTAYNLLGMRTIQSSDTYYNLGRGPGDFFLLGSMSGVKLVSLKEELDIKWPGISPYWKFGNNKYGFWMYGNSQLVIYLDDSDSTYKVLSADCEIYEAILVNSSKVIFRCENSLKIADINRMTQQTIGFFDSSNVAISYMETLANGNILIFYQNYEILVFDVVEMVEKKRFMVGFSENQLQKLELIDGTPASVGDDSYEGIGIFNVVSSRSGYYIVDRLGFVTEIEVSFNK